MERIRDVLNAGTPGESLLRVREDLIGKGLPVPGPFGVHPMIYADYVASGRALASVERFVLENVLPWYSNTHTEGSHCGATMSSLRREARQLVSQEVGATDAHAVIFSGSGATAGLNRLVSLLAVDSTFTVLIGPYEHHSNILPWKESGARVLEVPEDAEGGPDLAWLEQTLGTLGGPVVGAFSAASNTTGILTDTDRVTAVLKRFGAMAIWDYACAAPYVPIAMDGATAAKDAIVFSAHKFVGGPGASGVLVVRKDQVRTAVPSAPGGGTVRFVSPWDYVYSEDVAAREESGTPNVIGDIRAALALSVKAAVGIERIECSNADLSRRALAAWRGVNGLTVLGHPDAPRLPIFSFTVASPDGVPAHPQLVTRLLSDLYGIQARGGCSCAGPYGHRLLDIDEATSTRMRDAILAGDEFEKPGWTRVNLSWTMSEDEIEYILTAIANLPEDVAYHGPAYTVERGTARARYIGHRRFA